MAQFLWKTCTISKAVSRVHTSASVQHSPLIQSSFVQPNLLASIDTSNVNTPDTFHHDPGVMPRERN